MGKVGASRKAPPVLMTMESSDKAQYLIRNCSRLSKVTNLRRVFVTPDLSKQAREERRKMIVDLKKKITDFPDQRWVIRSGTITSVGRFVPGRDKDDKNLDRSFRY